MPISKKRGPMHRGKNQGQSTVEFSIALPLFLLLVFGIVEFSRVFYEWHALYRIAQTAVREAAMTPQPSADMRAHANEVIDALKASYNFTFVGDPVIDIPGMNDPANWHPDLLDTNPIRVTLNARFNSAVTLIPGLQNLTLSTTAAAFHSHVRIVDEPVPSPPDGGTVPPTGIPGNPGGVGPGNGTGPAPIYRTGSPVMARLES